MPGLQRSKTPATCGVRHALHWLTVGARSLVIGLCLLLFLQWPLREWIQAYSRQANDIGQILFALYAAVGITAASLRKSHLAIAHRRKSLAPGNARWRNGWLLLCVGPWALFITWTAVPQMLASIAQLESFSEGNTPGYFVLRMAVVLLAVLVLAEALCSAIAPAQQPQQSEDA